ncbi:bifunctional diguanylate cyclase/phosphodiesterase [Paraburkholderia terrae]|uniref:putative bifunctional diguanylate cyclase/phosphodiesterase n=1 Tax=Paraburkholderia terrae TaxID=311230 RepID=UPI001EE27440|nr:bifunctional diguanylate cyclase/phosphodiesterase [Paraburkholderia terrae]GJH04570.1 EAL domain-containing protein [Paraburkholderia terrae]
MSAILAVLVICVAIYASISATFSHEAEDRQLRSALLVTSDLEELLRLHVAANTDFLNGVGKAGYGSWGWPVRRATAVAKTYDRLLDELANFRDASEKMHQLRRLSAIWPEQLDAAARNLALADTNARSVQPASLQQANRTLGSIMVLLAQVSADQRERIARMQFASQDQLVRQRISLAVASAVGVLLLLFALSMRQRAALAKVASTIAATEAQRRFQEYFERHPVAMLIFDVNSFEILTANAAAQRQYGCELRAASIDQLRPAADVDDFRRDLQRYVASGDSGGLGGVRRHKHADGTVFYVDITYHFLDFAGRDACFVTAHNVTAHEAAKKALRLRSRALEASRNAVVISSREEGDSVVTYVNAAFARTTGRSVDEATGASHWEMIGCDPASPDVRSIDESLNAGRACSGLFRSHRCDGSEYWIELNASPVFGDGDQPTHFVTVFSDVSERIRYQDQLRIQAYEDALTHLPNRLGLKARLGDLVKHAADQGTTLALVFLDIDNFKEINDTLGHTAGDEVLCEVARRLSMTVSSAELVVRYAGDEFVAVLHGRGDADSLVAAADEMKNALNVGFCVGDALVVPQASVGIAVYPDHSTDPETLLGYADAAMYQAKSTGPNSLQLFNPEIASRSTKRALMAQALRRAISSDEISVVYQPRVNSITGRTIGFEALARWCDPEQGFVSPSLFIPLAEETGSIVSIGERVLEQACRQTAIWAQEYPDLVVSVNVSPVQFERSDLPFVIAETIKRTGVCAHNLELEITEGVLMAPRSLATLRALRELGLSIAIDDFGSGYSSLSYIRTFMADRLKLDMSFVRGIGCSRADEVIVRAVIALGKTLGMRVVAEGVETPEQLEFLVDNGCDEVQGFWFAPPSEAVTARSYLRGEHAACMKR